MKNLLFVLATAFLVTACGGGGGGGSAAPATTEEPVVVVSTDQTPEEPVEPIALSRINKLEAVSGVVVSDAESSNDIVVPEGFNLETEQAFSLMVNHEHTNADAYLSVCTDFEHAADGSLNINYDSCIVRTSLEYQTFEADIAVTNDVKKLAAALWFLDTSIDPIYAEWVLADVID